MALISQAFVRLSDLVAMAEREGMGDPVLSLEGSGTLMIGAAPGMMSHLVDLSTDRLLPLRGGREGDQRKRHEK